MQLTQSSRRELLLLSLAATAPALVAGSGQRVRLGGPIFKKTDDPREQAQEHRRLGYSAAYCPAGLKAGNTAAIEEARKAFAANDVVIAEVGAWVNMLDPDENKRKQNMHYVLERLTLADEIGATCCVDIGGSYNPKEWDGPDARNFGRDYFDATVRNCRYLIDTAKPKRTKFSIEMMGWSLPNTPSSYLKLIRAVDRPQQFGAHVDVSNIIDSPQRYYNNAAIIEEVFRELGPYILSCHAKDVGPHATHFTEVIPGQGGVNYGAYLRGIASLPRETPLMLEHLRTAEEYDQGRSYIQKVAAQAGVSFA